ncbi:kinesin-like protein KIF20A isoform X2 [Girardinichthys multiradiatus]|uniref:kinesin-like protein KIF20A isoform X2 n=1 Tax=Girardinichthys multiradiatus TaxID=208333 RepID=UPI001FACDABB|nr:kinesin-like protein KIF20A isoform X2 [Girardinichthys multiradiatus]
MAEMMESCFSGIPKRVGPVEVEDIKRNLLGDLDALVAQSQTENLQENLQVYLRVRPFTTAESNSGASQDCVTMDGSNTVVLKAPRIGQPNRQGDKSFPQTAQRFTFTQVFGPEASQKTVFEGSVRGLVQDVLQGGNCLVFTYGVTNAGKTFTFLGPDHNSGLLPRSLSVIFNSMEGRLYGRSDLKPQRCRDFSRLTPDQQAAEISSKRNLLRLLKENDKSLTAGKSASFEGSSISSDGSMNSVSETDSFCLDFPSNVRFSVWVSFCEIYNENIHDLLEQVPSGQHKRTVLRLSQDVKGNSFIKDLRWVQVNSSEEAYKVMKIGKRNQSLSATRLNQLSSRSHSIFSIRILRIDDSGVPRVHSISELALCDLAGSERCSRTHNTGERLKEAGNINGSLLTLGKCINAMRLNQNTKFQHHVPFRESKLTHFLQFFFCGSGRVSMVVNINQNSSCFDETLNVLKFSALAQKVVVVNSRPVVLDDSACHKSAMELSLIIDEADQRRNMLNQGRRSSLVAWETSLEDVLEAEDSEEWKEEEEEDFMEGTVLEAGGEEEDGDRTMEEETEKFGQEAALRLVLEAQIREEVSAEFMELFNKMEKDYSERLEKEKEILEERAEKRVEILKNLISKTVDLSVPDDDDCKEAAPLEGIISFITEDLRKIRNDAQSIHHCLTEQAHTAEIEALRLEKLQTHDQLQDAMKSLEQQQQRLSKLSEICEQKDDVISKLQEASRNATRDRPTTCSCGRRTEGDDDKEQESGKRQRGETEEQGGGAAKKRVVLEEEIWRLQEVNNKKEETICELREREQLRRELEEEAEELKRKNLVLEQKVQELTDLDNCLNCDSVLSSLEGEQKETARLQKENKALVNGIFQLQTEVTTLQTQLKQQTDTSNSLSKQVDLAKSRIQYLENQSKEEGQSSSLSVLHAAMEELKKKSQVEQQKFVQTSQQMKELQKEKRQLEEQLAHRNSSCVELRQEMENQRAEFSQQLQNLRVEVESEGRALQLRLEEERRHQLEEEVAGLQRVMLEKEQLLAESQQHTETLRRELHCLKEKLYRTEEDEEKENQSARRPQGKRKDVREPHLHRDAQDSSSPSRSNTADRKKLSKTVKRKRKSSEVEGLVFSESKRNRVKGRARSNKLEDGMLQKIEELLQNSQSILNSKADPAPSTTVSRPRRLRKKLFKLDASSPLLDSPHTMLGGGEEDKESDHLIIRRQLRSNSCRK